MPSPSNKRWTPALLKEAEALRASGKSNAAIGRHFDVSGKRIAQVIGLRGKPNIPARLALIKDLYEQDLTDEEILAQIPEINSLEYLRELRRTAGIKRPRGVKPSARSSE